MLFNSHQHHAESEKESEHGEVYYRKERDVAAGLTGIVRHIRSERNQAREGRNQCTASPYVHTVEESLPVFGKL